MQNMFDVAHILVEDVRRRFADTIAIVAYYGSYAYGTATRRSDLDFFFIPDGPKALDASLQFILDGIGFDFWPITWARAERIASYDEPIVPVIAESQVLHSRSDADLDRFESLRAKIRSMSLPENRKTMLRKAQGVFSGCYRHLVGVTQAARKNDLSQTRRHAAQLATLAVESLALTNQTFFRKGMGQNMDEIMALKIKPEGLESLLDTIASSAGGGEIAAACEALVEKTGTLLSEEEESPGERAPFAVVASGFHEEALSMYNKIIAACERGDRETAFYASLNLQGELESILALADGQGAYERLGLPDLAAEFDATNLASFGETVAGMEARFRNVLKSRQVALREFGSIEEFREFVRNR